MTRAIVIWVPDWPVIAFQRTTAQAAARRTAVAAGPRPPAPPAPAPAPAPATIHPRPENPETSGGLGAGVDSRGEGKPVAVLQGGRVIACSATAREQGVRRGQRRRDAQAACPTLLIAAADPGRDERSFDPVLSRLEGSAPGVQPLRPGLAVVRARGPARFYGGEERAARALLDELSELGLADARAGVADGIFTAERAARATEQSAGDRATFLTPSSRIRIVPPGASGAFLAPLPISALEDPPLIGLLTRLGVHTLGGFAGLDLEQVRTRFGEQGARLHALAGGSDSRLVSPRAPTPQLVREIAFEPPLELSDQVAFAVRTTAEAVCDAAASSGMVCTEVRIILTDDRGRRSERIWLHPTFFDAADVVDRVRWQLQADEGLTGGVAAVRIEPEALDATAHHQPALIGQGPDERLHHALSRVQAMLGHRGVVTPVIGGGRWLAEREARVAWGDGERSDGSRDRPWPGSLPSPLPSEVFRSPRAARVLGADGRIVSVDERGLLTAAPAALDGHPLVSWAGPWPVIERGWDGERARRAHRFQLVDETQTAWLAVCEQDGWWIEGRYG